MMVKVRAAFAAALLVVAGVLIAGCGSTSSSSNSGGGSTSNSSTSAGSGSGKPLQILYVGDTTGPTREPGLEQLAGLKAGVAYWNANGGFDGRQAKITQINDNGDPATAISQTVRYLSSNPAPDLVWAGTEGNTIAAMIPFVSRRGLVSMSVNDGNLQCARNAASACSTYFSFGGAPSVPTTAAASWFRSRGITKVGILEESIAFTQSETPSIESALRAAGISYTKASFPSTSVDLTSQISALKSAGAQAVYAEALGPPAGYALAARSKLGWDAPMLFDVAGSSLDLSRLASASDLRGAYVTVGSPTNGANSIRGVDLMVQNAGPGGLGTQPLYIAAFPWDALVTYRNAIMQAKSTDPKAVASALENLSPTAQSDPLLANTRKVGFSADDHENIGLAPTDYQFIPAGPIVNGRIGAAKG